MRREDVRGGAVWDGGRANEKQKRFFMERRPFIAYGGAKGGGKTWAVRTKAVGGAIGNPGIRILIMRRTYPELEENHIRPIVGSVPKEIGTYTASVRRMTFFNGSTIKFGHWAGELSELEYQGQEFDWIFLDEATQFTERAFNYLKGCLRGVSPYQKRMYITCNPGGVGHGWVKRLFVDRDFRIDASDPERSERPEDYVFIPATVEDNEYMLRYSPNYLSMLAQMPDNVRRAYRYGDWDALGGCYFSEFRYDLHTYEPVRLPGHWRRYRALDYGLDMLAALWIAVDEYGRCRVYREWTREKLIVRDAALGILERTLPGEEITATFAPPDLWSRQKDTGRTMEEIFRSCGLPLTRAGNNRVQGHMMVKDMLSPGPDGPMLTVSRDCQRLIGDLTAIQADERDPNDCAKEPHEVTHTVDALRYFCVSRIAPAEPEDGGAAAEEGGFFGGEPTLDYINYFGR